jgi:hypothetical protein
MAATKTKKKTTTKKTKKPAARKDYRKPLPPLKKGEVRLLSGGNPQIAKGSGDAPVQAFIAALPGWKGPVAKRIDQLITRAVPKLKKAVKWNSPLYGTEARGYFLGIHAFAKYLKLAFIKGQSLKPRPPEASKDPHTRYFHIFEDDELDEKQLTSWIKQAAAIEGWMLKT